VLQSVFDVRIATGSTVIRLFLRCHQRVGGTDHGVKYDLPPDYSHTLTQSGFHPVKIGRRILYILLSKYQVFSFEQSALDALPKRRADVSHAKFGGRTVLTERNQHIVDLALRGDRDPRRASLWRHRLDQAMPGLQTSGISSP
jgi:hypothetical protein